MIPSGLNVHDEVDASNADVITQYENRLQAQEDGGWRWYFSHPSLSGHGVDVYWQKSDKKEWFIKYVSVVILIDYAINLAKDFNKFFFDAYFWIPAAFLVLYYIVDKKIKNNLKIKNELS